MEGGFRGCKASYNDSKSLWSKATTRRPPSSYLRIYLTSPPVTTVSVTVREM